MSRASRIEALRRLAERPGTEHEGNVAREMLRRMRDHPETDAQFSADEQEPLAAYKAYMRREMTVDAFVEALGKFRAGRWNCACGSTVNKNETCPNWQRHMEIQTEIRAKFKKGDRVLYNYHAYPPDCAGRVAGYISLKPERGTYPWAWLSIKFDYLKSARQVPIFSAEDWHLKHAERVESDI